MHFSCDPSRRLGIALARLILFPFSTSFPLFFLAFFYLLVRFPLIYLTRAHSLSLTRSLRESEGAATVGWPLGPACLTHCLLRLSRARRGASAGGRTAGARLGSGRRSPLSATVSCDHCRRQDRRAGDEITRHRRRCHDAATGGNTDLCSKNPSLTAGAARPDLPPARIRTICRPPGSGRPPGLR